MASGLTLARNVGSAVGHVAVGSVAEVVGGGGLGFVHAKWKDRWYGEYAPEIAAGVGKVALALARGFGGSDSWITDIVGGAIASPGMVLTSAKYGIKLAEYLEEKKSAPQKKLPAKTATGYISPVGYASQSPVGIGYVPPAGADAMTISEDERRRFAAAR